MYMEHQGYKVKQNQLMKDNMSATKTEKNGQNSCTVNSQHIKIRYFFVKDMTVSMSIGIFHCPTEVILSNYFTKLLHGRLFHMLREVIMGGKHISTLHQMPVPSRERVGECINGREKSKKRYVEALKTGMA